MADFEVKVLRGPAHQRILQDDKLLTFAVVVGEDEYHQQLSILEYDTREKIEARMAEIGVQVYEEISKARRNSPVPDDIMAMLKE